MSGYSGTPLSKKLGYKSGMRALLINPPDEYTSWVDPLPEVVFSDHPPYDIVHIFENNREALEAHVGQCRNEIAQNGMIWISWYKKASKLPSEITEDIIRDVVFPHGLVDIKVCSVNAEWSGLKVVIRKELRT